ncbi:hypothetical protein GMSM_06050 [Geomonas sp. Red276]
MAGRTTINEDNIFPRLVIGSLALAAVAGAATALLVSAGFGISLFTGGVLATANFLWIRRGLQAALAQLPANASRFALFRFILRLAIMALLLYVLIVKLKASIFGLVIGLSVVVINIIAFSIYLSVRKGG